MFRQQIYLEKDRKIRDLNSKPEHTFTVGHNFMSTFTDEEYHKMLLPSSPPKHAKKSHGHPKKLTELNMEWSVVEDYNLKNLPTSVDWRKEGGVNPIKN